MLGYAPRELLGTSVFGYMAAASQVDAISSLEQCARGARAAVDSTFRHRNGTAIWCNIAATQLLDADGVHIGNLGVVRDETERRKLQAQLMASDRMASVGTLAAGVAHEINNPLAALIANLDFLSEAVATLAATSRPGVEDFNNWLRSDLVEPLDDAREASQRVRFIVRDLKLFSRSPIEDPKTPVAVKTVLESSLRMAWNEIRHRARLVKSYGPALGISANEARLGQVFLNLLVNAAQSIPEGRVDHNEIHVTTRMEGQRVIIEISDTGAGIAPEVLPRIFDAFFTTKAVGVGTGLGLAISQRLVSDMDGELTVTSELGKGTTFRVSIPIAKSLRRDNVALPETPPVEARRGRILVIDDETLVVRGIVRTLSHEHEVVALDAARSALMRCSAGEAFDLILCDLMMPDMSGMELHRELSRVAPTQADRMIFMTGGAFTTEARRFLSESVKEHLEKPFDPVNLRAIVQRYMRHAGSPAAQNVAGAID